jgi:hypothetical protein
LGRAYATLVLPAQGRLMVSTDLHGNREDLLTLRQRFESARAAGEDLHWALLGDLVHGPDDQARANHSELYGYPDDSPELAGLVLEVARAHPGRVHYVLGNHDFGHVGGPHTHKFHPDEVEFLEERCTPAQRAQLQELFCGAYVLLAAPCGALLSHGSPDATLSSLRQLEGLPLPLEQADPRRRLLFPILCSYGQAREATQKVLTALAPEVGFRLSMVIHGHDRDESGWFTEGGNQGQPVIFGAPRHNKRYLWLDLAARYRDPEALREGEEIRRLYPTPGLG